MPRTLFPRVFAAPFAESGGLVPDRFLAASQVGAMRVYRALYILIGEKSCCRQAGDPPFGIQLSAPRSPYTRLVPHRRH